MKRAIFQSYTLVKNAGYKDAFEWSLRSWAEWCTRWGIPHYLRKEKYNFGDTQFINQLRYEPLQSVSYDFGVLVDCFTLIHPMTHPDTVFSDVGYVNITEDGREFISVVAGTSDYLNGLVYVDKCEYGSRSLFERDAAILQQNSISKVVQNSVDMTTVTDGYEMFALNALIFQPCIVRFGNHRYNKNPNIYWTKCCNYVDKSVY